MGGRVDQEEVGRKLETGCRRRQRRVRSSKKEGAKGRLLLPTAAGWGLLLCSLDQCQILGGGGGNSWKRE